MRGALLRTALALTALAAARSAADLGRRGAAAQGGLWARSLAAYTRRENAEALSAVRGLLASDPDNPLYRRHEAAVLFAASDFPGAAAALERFIRSAPEPTQACPLVANAYRRMGDPGRFLDALRRCAAFDPRNAENAFNLAQGLEEAGRLAEAGDAYARIASEGFVGAMISLGRVRLRQGRGPEAEAIARAVAAREPGNAAAAILAGQAALARGDKGRARADFERAARLAPAHPAVRDGLERAGR
ncbi:MAG: tetratricopeptide repeat protein [Elusimicrobia bacterium]|nr:tetratricopeptide repeat protein [Elusimicrobiota bacterium]